MLAAALPLLVQSTPDLAADFAVPEGLALTLWAESPELHNPTAIDVDERGRVWVTEAVNYRSWNNPEARTRPEGDRVVLLEDTDGDGRCDSARVFAQDPELVAPLGILVRSESSAYVSCSPSILLYTDANGDGDALDPGEKDVLLTGFGGRDHDHGLHSLVRGPRARLFFTVGNAGPHLVTDKSGWTLRAGSLYREGGAQPSDNKPGLVSDDGRVYTGGLVLSVNPDGTRLWVEAHNFRNPCEVAADVHGELFTFDNDDEVSACRASWILRGGNHGFASADGSRTWRADQRPGQSTPAAHWHQEDPGVVPGGTLTGAGGPAGVLLYPGGALDPWLHARLLACDAGRGAVLVFEPVRAGVGLALEPRATVLASRAERESESARWFRPSDVDAGPDGSLLVADWYDPGVGGHRVGDAQARGRILRLAPRAAAAAALPPPARTDTRLTILAGMREAPLERARASLLALARWFDGTDPVFLEAYGLACAGREEEVLAWLAPELGGEPARWSPRFAALAWRLHPPSLVGAFLERALDASLPREARKRSIDALAFVKTPAAAEAMASLAAASSPDLRPYARWWLEHRSTNDWRAWVDRSTLGGRLEDAELVWRSGLLRAGRSEVDLDVRGATRLWLVVAEGEHGIDYDWADWLEPRFEGAGAITRLAELDWLSARSGWGTTQVGRNCEGGPLVVEGATFTDGIGTHARAEIAYAVPAGAERFRASAAPDDMGSRRPGSTIELEFQVWLERPPARAPLESWLEAAFDPHVEPHARLAALRALAADPEGGLVLVRAAERGELDATQRAAIAERLFTNPDLGVRARASAHFARPGERPRPSVEALLALRGDPAKGRELFLDPRAQCSTCHAFELGGRRCGGDLGPELTGVRAKLDGGRILDALLNPSAEIAHGFETWRVETADGALRAGFLLADGPTLVLKDTQGRRHVIAAEEVVARERETLSVMPDGVAAGLTDQELADLLAFLREDPAREPVFGPELALWNGRDLAGWGAFLGGEGARPEDVWSVRDGVLACRGEPFGYLFTEARYRSFELTLEWRFDPARGPGNSGVLLRKVGEERIWPRSIEAQLQHTNAGDLWNIGGFPMAVDAERTEGRRTARSQPCSERALGEWNRYRIRLDRGELTLEVNGVVQNTASWCQEVPGQICLQSEGAWIEFRDVRLREILD
jgi:putative membrane-bound dehydrogenase-like protein